MTAADVRRLGEELWEWRRVQQPCTGDDIPRLRRPPGWTPEVTAAGFAQQRVERDRYAERWRAIDPTGLDVADAVDHRLLGSVLSRAAWELDVLRSWQRDPLFYVHQALGPYFDRLLPPPPFDAARGADIVAALQAAPRAFEEGRANLSDAAAPFARSAISLLAGIDANLAQSAAALAPLLPGAAGATVTAAAETAGAAAVGFREWLMARLDNLPSATAVGREAFVWFLRNVALMAETPDAMVAAARQEWQRAVAWEAVERAAAAAVPVPPMLADAGAQVRAEAAAEREVRDFYERAGLLSQPASLRHYLNLPMPGYIEPLRFLGVADDLTDDDRLDADGVSYVPAPSPTLPYFYAANARDPRAGIVHEGAHFQQLTLAFAHTDPLRRRYYDSGSNEGIAFYNEELMLQAGLFAAAPHTRVVIWNFARLRALRVEADVGLATGDLTLDDAVAFFVDRVPMDRDTAFEESSFYAGNPGLALSYQIGKLQLQRLLGATAKVQGDAFTVRAFHDWVWRNGNLPFSLQRWELTGQRDDLDVIDADPLTGAPTPDPDWAR